MLKYGIDPRTGKPVRAPSQAAGGRGLSASGRLLVPDDKSRSRGALGQSFRLGQGNSMNRSQFVGGNEFRKSGLLGRSRDDSQVHGTAHQRDSTFASAWEKDPNQHIHGVVSHIVSDKAHNGIVWKLFPLND